MSVSLFQSLPKALSILAIIVAVLVLSLQQLDSKIHLSLGGSSSNSSSSSVHSKCSQSDTITSHPSISDENQKDSNESKAQECSFLQPYNSQPLPLILMAMGRTGSSVTWDTLSTLLGSTTKAYEITGGNATKSKNYFDSIDPQVGERWAIERLCHVQKWNANNFEDPVISGFQWKPYPYTLEHPYGNGALELIAKFNHPPIRILYLTRNPLDKIISNMRHKGFQHSEEVPAHCAIDDTECIKRHELHTQGITFPRPHELVHEIKGSMAHDQEALDHLSSIGIKHLTVTYENLYESDNVKEWVRIFDFLGRSPKNVKNYRKDLTRKHINKAFSYASTSTKHHEDIIVNYSQVKKVLAEARLDYLLH